MQLLQSVESIELFFADMITNYLNLTQDKVLIMYSENGQVTYGIDVDAAYVHVVPVNDIRLQYKERNLEYNEQSDDFTLTQQSMRTLELHLVFYGPNSVENAQKFSEYVHTEIARYQMAKNNLNLVGEMQNGPNHIHELKSGKWYKRTDLTLAFYNAISIEETIERIVDADIKIEYDL